MAYSQANPPALITQGIGGFWRLWIYKSTDAPTVVDGAGYFTNGYTLGMRQGDVVFVVDTDASPISMQVHIVTLATTTSVSLSDGTAITSTNTD